MPSSSTTGLRSSASSRVSSATSMPSGDPRAALSIQALAATRRCSVIAAPPMLLFLFLLFLLLKLSGSGDTVESTAASTASESLATACLASSAEPTSSALAASSLAAAALAPSSSSAAHASATPSFVHILFFFLHLSGSGIALQRCRSAVAAASRERATPYTRWIHERERCLGARHQVRARTGGAVLLPPPLNLSVDPNRQTGENGAEGASVV